MDGPTASAPPLAGIDAPQDAYGSPARAGDAAAAAGVAPGVDAHGRVAAEAVHANGASAAAAQPQPQPQPQPHPGGGKATHRSAAAGGAAGGGPRPAAPPAAAASHPHPHHPVSFHAHRASHEGMSFAQVAALPSSAAATTLPTIPAAPEVLADDTAVGPLAPPPAAASVPHPPGAAVAPAHGTPAKGSAMGPVVGTGANRPVAASHTALSAAAAPAADAQPHHQPHHGATAPAGSHVDTHMAGAGASGGGHASHRATMSVVPANHNDVAAGLSSQFSPAASMRAATTSSAPGNGAAARKYKTQAIKEVPVQNRVGRFVVFEEKFLQEAEWNSLVKAPCGSLSQFVTSLEVDPVLQPFAPSAMLPTNVVRAATAPDPAAGGGGGVGGVGAGTGVGAGGGVGGGGVGAGAGASAGASGTATAPAGTTGGDGALSGAALAQLQHQYNAATAGLLAVKETLDTFARNLNVPHVDMKARGAARRTSADVPSASQQSKIDSLNKSVEKLSAEKRELLMKVKHVSKKHTQAQQAVVVLKQKLQRCGELIPDLVEDVDTADASK